jgi:hypothetical protein
MSGNVFYRLDPLLICLAFAGLLLVAVEIGFRAKGRKKADSDNIEKSDIAPILGGVMTLLALMLGFTFVMSQGRFETRRQLVVEEANAIETTYLRARTLPEPQSSEIQELLRQYTAYSTPVAHHEAFQRRKPHGGVYAFPVFYRRSTFTVAEMKGYQIQVLNGNPQVF